LLHFMSESFGQNLPPLRDESSPSDFLCNKDVDNHTKSQVYCNSFCEFS
jgi:hypothetical protein